MGVDVKNGATTCMSDDSCPCVDMHIFAYTHALRYKQFFLFLFFVIVLIISDIRDFVYFLQVWDDMIMESALKKFYNSDLKMLVQSLETNILVGVLPLFLSFNSKKSDINMTCLDVRMLRQ